MRCQRALIATLLCVSLVFCESNTRAQNQREEYFRVKNLSNDLIWVQLRALGRGTRNTEWQKPTEVKAGKPDKIVLVGYEPFDIVIHERDQSFYLASKQYICTMMLECRRTGKRDWTIPFQRGRYIKNQKGQYEFKLDGKTLEVNFEVLADANSVEVKYDPPRPPPEPPPIPNLPKKK